jgi:hypothetical protein
MSGRAGLGGRSTFEQVLVPALTVGKGRLSLAGYLPWQEDGDSRGQPRHALVERDARRPT